MEVLGFEERRVETKTALDRLQQRCENHETRFSSLEARCNSGNSLPFASAFSDSMTTAQELQVASFFEKAVGSSLRNQVDYAVRRTESLGDRVGALEDSIHGLGTTARLQSGQNPERIRQEVQGARRETADARWRSECSARAEADQRARAPSTPRNIAPPSTSRDRPLSAGAHRRLRSASPAASDGADRRPEVSEAWPVDPPRIPRHVTPPPM